MHGNRVATNGDIRFEQTPGQWAAPAQAGERKLSEAENSITTRLHYPDMDNHLQGFNPMIYPDCVLDYEVKVRGCGDAVVVTVDLDAPIPEAFAGKVFFNMELFPGTLYGKPWLLDGPAGHLPAPAQRADEEADAQLRDRGAPGAPAGRPGRPRPPRGAGTRATAPSLPTTSSPCPMPRAAASPAGRTTPTTASPSRARPATSPSTTAA